MRSFAQKLEGSQQAMSVRSAITDPTRFGPSCEVSLMLHVQHPITASSRWEHDFSQVPISLLAAGAIQAKSAISEPGDEYEQEADHVSQQVMFPTLPRQRASVFGGACFRGQAGQLSKEQECLQTKHVGASSLGQPSVPSIVHEVLRSPGQPLDPATRDFMEPRFGRDFGSVRIHTDTRAARSAEAVAAEAYTVGSNIVFASGRYAPSSRGGQRLLAHELTHIVQQARGGGPALRRQKKDGAGTNVPPKESPEVEELRRKLAEIERGWVRLRSLNPGGALSARWFARGAEVMALVRMHTNGLIEAIGRGDEQLRRQYMAVLETDQVAFEFVTWHTVYYLNLDLVHPWIKGIVEAFDRHATQYTGRKQAEERARALKDLAENAGKDSAARLPLIETNVKHSLQSNSGMKPVTLTTAADAKRRQRMQEETAKVQKVELAMEVIVVELNSFLAGARSESLGHAREGIEQVTVVGRMVRIFRGGGNKPTEQTRKEEGKRKQTDPTLKKEVRPGRRKKEDKSPAPIPQVEPEEDEEPKCRPKNDPCDTPLPIRWPTFLPLPSERRPLVRTPSKDAYIEPEKRSKPQRDMQEEINAARQKGVPPPRPCFRHDAEPNAPYDAHHMHPLYLGGAEDEINLCALRADYHQRGHPELNNQARMLVDPVWIACKICDGYLPHHPALQEYEIIGRK